ncbi:MAG: long-chain-fatty-acid--CoA ligase [Xanthomonadales bacterium]|jgi:long-chain acyl-CoA synthetase|nr:long-chain-fatty-acid--CoA ligase [Xanthomonadales bacterium]
MEKVWLQHYPPGVPADIDINAYQSLIQLFEDSFAKFADRTAFVCMDRKLSYRELDQLSQQFAGFLQAQGLKKGDRVAIMLPNILNYPVVLAGILRAGGVVVNVNPLYTPRELEHQLKDSGAQTIVVLENVANTLSEVIAKTPVKTVVLASVGDLLGFPKGFITNFVIRKIKKLVPKFSLPGAIPFNTALERGRAAGFKRAEAGHEDIAFLQYTGGTTGVSKGAVLLHKTIIGALLASHEWMKPALNVEPKIESPIIITALPLYHVFALVTCCLLGMRSGGMNLLIPNPRDMPKFIAEMKKYRFNMLPAVNTLFNGLLNQPEFATVDFSGLRVSNGGGMAVQAAVAEKWMKLTGCPIVEGFGMTETSSGFTCNSAISREYNGTVGIPMPGGEVSIRDDNGKEVPIGERGEICMRGPMVMKEYWQRPEETANVFWPDGFLKSGDIGVMDERGYTKIVDRKKDMILVSGFNVYPNEIEDVVAMHPGVLECAAVGVPDKSSGEAVKLFVVKKDPNLTEEQVMDYCKEQLTGYKKPKFIVFRADLPKTNVGKILRRELRDK